MSTHTRTMSAQEIQILEKKLAHAHVKKTPPYAIFQRQTSECTITAYTSGKVVFQGEGADAFVSTPSPTDTPRKKYPESGSDEVGTGDYFGPVVVCATHITEEDLPLLQTLRIQDSKQLKDDDIMSIAPSLMAHITYSLLVLENAKYNEVHVNNNMNAIKAKLHNKAFLHLEKKVGSTLPNIIIDQFTPKASYYRYIKDEAAIVKDIHFETKAENKYVSVACGSIIARYSFLKALEQMGEHYDFDFPKGAGAHVDEAGVEFVKQHGWDTLHSVSKYHFKNSEKIKELL